MAYLTLGSTAMLGPPGLQKHGQRQLPIIGVYKTFLTHFDHLSFSSSLMAVWEFAVLPLQELFGRGINCAILKEVKYNLEAKVSMTSYEDVLTGLCWMLRNPE